MAEPPSSEPVPVVWDEAREILVVVLLGAATMHLVGPMVRYLASDSPFSVWDDLSTPLNNVNALTGTLLLGAAVAVCSTPAADVVPRLRQAVYLLGVVVAALAALSTINVLAVTTAGDRFFLRVGIVLWRPGPALLLAGSAAWMARHVVVFPSR